MRHLHVLLLLFSVCKLHGYNVSVNSNRGYLFGDVLEPLCSVNTSGQSLTSLEVIELFHVWEKYTSAQVAASSSSIDDYRKAMPCFPGPSLNLTSSSDDMLPPYPNCDEFVNVSTATMDEVEDLLSEVGKRGERSSSPLDVSLKSVMNSLSNRLQNLIDYLPNGKTRNKAENLLASLTNMNTRPMPLPFLDTPFDLSQLLTCVNLNTLPNLSGISSQTIGTIICSTFSICSYSDVSSNQCLSNFNITEQQYNSIVNKTVGELIGSQKGKPNLNPRAIMSQFFGELSRSKRTPKPRCENCTEDDYEDGSGMEQVWDERPVKMDGREEGSGEDDVPEMQLHFEIDPDEFLDSSGDLENEEQTEQSGNFTHQDVDVPQHHHSYTFDPEDFLESSGEEVDDVRPHEGNFSKDDDVMSLLNGHDVPHPNADLQSSLPPVSHNDESLLSSDEPSLEEQMRVLLATKLNMSILEYGASFVNDTSLKWKVATALPSLGSEFTVGELLEKINITESSQLLQLVSALGSVMGTSIPDVETVLEKVSASGVDVGSVVNKLLQGGGTEGIADTIKEKLGGSSNSSISEMIENMSRASTLPSALQSLLDSTDSSAKISDALNSLQSTNSSLASALLSKLNLK